MPCLASALGKITSFMDSVFQNLSLKLLAEYMEPRNLADRAYYPSCRTVQDPECTFYGRIMVPTAHSPMNGGVLKVVPFSYQNYAPVCSKEMSDFLDLPEEQNNDCASSEWPAIFSGYSLKRFKCKNVFKVEGGKAKP